MIEVPRQIPQPTPFAEHRRPQRARVGHLDQQQSAGAQHAPGRVEGSAWRGRVFEHVRHPHHVDEVVRQVELTQVAVPDLMAMPPRLGNGWLGNIDAVGCPAVRRQLIEEAARATAHVQNRAHLDPAEQLHERVVKPASHGRMPEHVP